MAPTWAGPGLFYKTPAKKEPQSQTVVLKRGRKPTEGTKQLSQDCIFKILHT